MQGCESSETDLVPVIPVIPVIPVVLACTWCAWWYASSPPPAPLAPAVIKEPAMGETQHFRLAGTTNVEEIDHDHVDGHTVIYWEDIEQIFPGVKHVKNGNVSVKLLRDSNRNR
ncbi:MAG: hypothetical protein J3Q66DRAFT_388224 [Benniella sp.]|nr:MAG: hypothetical protein J3Q66DRAFT_388224 [Benniella sp.]